MKDFCMPSAFFSALLVHTFRVILTSFVQPLYSSSKEHSRFRTTGSGFRGPCFFSLDAKGIVSPKPKSTKGLCVPKKLSKIS